MNPYIKESVQSPCSAVIRPGARVAFPTSSPPTYSSPPFIDILYLLCHDRLWPLRPAPPGGGAMNLFGKKKAAPAPNTADAIMKLRGTMETLEKRSV